MESASSLGINGFCIPSLMQILIFFTGVLHYRCTGIGDNGLAAIASRCRKLRKLNLCYCAQITDKGLKHLSGLEELSDLEMRSLVKISSMGLTAIAIGCKSLVELDVKRCYHIDDMALCALVQHARNLRQVLFRTAFYEGFVF